MSLRDLRKALLSEDLAQADALLAQGELDLNAPVQGQTLLWWAVAQGKRASLDWLLDQGADPDQRSGANEETPLAAAVHTGQLPLITHLVSRGADLNKGSQDDLTPLMLATQHLSRPFLLVKHLVELGADPSRVTRRDGHTALMLALTEKTTELVQLLKDAGADPEQANREGRRAIHVAARTNNERVVEELLAVFPKLDLDTPTPQGMTALGQAHNAKVIELLLRAGANPMVRSINPFDEGLTPLMALLGRKGNDNAVEMALRKGAKVNEVDFTGKSNLAYALLSGNWVGMEQLYLHGLPKDAPVDRVGSNPYLILANLMAKVGPGAQDLTMSKLMVPNPAKEAANAQAAEVGEILERLALPVDLGVTAGVSPEIPHYSPLAYALSQEALVFFAPYLIERGADPNRKGPNGRAPLHALVDLDARLMRGVIQAAAVEASVAQMRTEERDPPLTEKELAHLDKQLEGAQMVQDQAWKSVGHGLATLEQAASLDVNVVDNRGWTPLEMAARENAAQMAVALVQRGADPHAPNAEGFHAFGLALYEGQNLTLQALMDQAQAQGRPWQPTLDDLVLVTPEEHVDYRQRQRFLATVQGLAQRPEWATWRDQVDEQGNSALILAAATGQADLVHLLLQLGGATMVNHTNHLGETALIHAAGQQDGRMIDALRARGADPTITPASGVTVEGLVQKNPYLAADLRQDPMPLEALPARPDLVRDAQVAQGVAQRASNAFGPLPVVKWGPIITRIGPGASHTLSIGLGSPAEQLYERTDEELGLGKPPVSLRQRQAATAPPASVVPDAPPVRPTRRRSP